MLLETDLLIVGGGIHGCGIARDASGRGLRVVLTEAADLASGTSSASSKMIHGGLRYLEQFEFRLVREALAEREVLLRAAPHLVRPLGFVMPHAKELRPAWMIRAGLVLYDWLARRDTLPASTGLRLDEGEHADVLKPQYLRGFAYSDCRVDDARLVIANALAASELGARIFTRTACVAAKRERSSWRATLRSPQGEDVEVVARAVVNATGPAARVFLSATLGIESGPNLKRVQGSHIVVPRFYSGDHAFILQNDDGRVVFVCPFGEHTLVGTTDIALADETPCAVTSEEITYLCHAVNRYFRREIGSGDVVWSYCGVRALVDDGAQNPARVTRDYVLHLDEDEGRAPVLSVFGGKLTTYRPLAERAVEMLTPALGIVGRGWTAAALLPGGDIAAGDVAGEVHALQTASNLPQNFLEGLVQRHGARARNVLGAVRTVEDLGIHFGAQVYARELDYFIEREWARCADDILWRRTKWGLYLDVDQQRQVEEYVSRRARSL